MAVFHGQRVFLSRKWLPAEVISRLQDVLKECGADTCIYSDLSCNGSTDFHVLVSLDGERFEEVRAKGCNVVSPECVLRCARERRPLPIRRFTCCLCMEGVRILATGFSSGEKERIEHLVGSMCGEIQDDPSLIDFVIAKNVLAAKYKSAQKWRKPVVTIDWLNQCSKEHRLVPAEPYKLQPFLGLNICMTHYAGDIRQDMESRTVSHGGQVSKNLTRECTHLIAKFAQGDKYRVAKAWGSVSLVNEQWFWQSIEAKACLDEALFPVSCSATDQTNRGKALVAVPEPPCFATCTTLGLSKTPISQTVVSLQQAAICTEPEMPKTPRDQSAVVQQQPPTDVVHCNKQQDHMGIAEAYGTYAGNGLYLSACRVHLLGFQPEEEKKLVDMLRDGGATRFIEFNDMVTHVIVGQPSEANFQELRNWIMWGAVHVVLRTWLLECTKHRREISIQSHVLPPNYSSQGNSLKQVNAPDGPPPSIGACTVDAGEVTPARGGPSTHLQGGEAAAVDVSPPSRSGSLCVEIGKNLMQPPNLVTSGPVTVPATQLEIVKSKRSSSCVFVGYTFAFLDPAPSQQASEVMNLIVQCGGSLEQDILLQKLNFVVFSYESRSEARLYNGPAELVSYLWIRHCATDDKLIDVKSHILYRPLQDLVPLTGFEKYVLCPSQLIDRERELMAQLCKLLGGRFSEDLVRQVTHLICKVPKGPKYEAATGSLFDSMAIVSQEWLNACASQSKIVPIDDYLIRKEAPRGNHDERSATPLVECEPAIASTCEVPVALLQEKPATMKEPITVDPQQTEAEIGAKGKKGGSRGKPIPPVKRRSRADGVRLTQGQNQAEGGLDPWDVLAAPWSCDDPKKKKMKTSPDLVRECPIPVGPSTRSQLKVQAPVVPSDAPTCVSPKPQVEEGGEKIVTSREVTICENPVTDGVVPQIAAACQLPKPANDGGNPELAGACEPQKDSGDGQFSEDVAAAIEGLLAQTTKVVFNGSTKMDVDSVLLSPERTPLSRMNRDDSSSQSEFKRSKPNWHRARSSNGESDAVKSATKQFSHDRFEDTQQDSQVVGYDEDHAGRQLIIERVRTRSSTKAKAAGSRRAEKNKDAWKERLCRVADRNK